MTRIDIRLLLAVLLLFGGPVDAAESPSFHRDVMAVLSKAGCNQGTCHGNANGKGGLKLSLRGEDPATDYRTLSRDVTGRRTNRLSPSESLLLRKPTMAIAHEGGLRFAADSPEYRILRDWIAAGTPLGDAATGQVTELDVEPESQIVSDPNERVAIRVVATYAGGETRDVTRWSVFEPSQPIVEISEEGVVRPLQLGELTVVVRHLNQQKPVRLAFISATERPWTAPDAVTRIDELVFSKLKSLRIVPSPVCEDVTFVRRVYLDLLGLLPPVEEARRFIASTQSHKRSRLIDELLDRPEFAEHWAMKWSDLLRNEETTLDRKGVENLHTWLRVQIANDTPWNQLVHELLASRGSTYTSPAANYYRALRDPFVRAETTAQVFLGVRLQCAKCHSHPFDRWTQNDYYAWTNAFSRVGYKIVENKRRDDNDSHEFDGEQIVYMKPEGDLADPRTGKPRSPRMLDESHTPIDEGSDRLEELADWVVAPENPYFARAQVNRIWFHLMGRGLVDPIDDFRATNPASHPELLDWLTADFIANEYRLKPLIRQILNSTTYQLSCETNDSNVLDEMNYSHAIPKRIPAEVLADALAQTLGTNVSFQGYPEDVRAGQLPGVVTRRARRRAGPEEGDRFLKTFGKPPRLQSCECERVETPTLAQTFQLVSGPLLDDLLTEDDNQIGQWLEEGRSDSDIVRELTWQALSREPTAAEFELANQRLAAVTDKSGRRVVLEDLAWALVNSNEFLFRR